MKIFSSSFNQVEVERWVENLEKSHTDMLTYLFNGWKENYEIGRGGMFFFFYGLSDQGRNDKPIYATSLTLNDRFFRWYRCGL